MAKTRPFVSPKMSFGHKWPSIVFISAFMKIRLANTTNLALIDGNVFSGHTIMKPYVSRNVNYLTGKVKVSMVY